MTGPEHGDLRLRLAKRLEQQRGRAATALAEAGAEDEALQPSGQLATLQQVAGDVHGLVFQMTTAKGVEAFLQRNDHL